MLTQRQIDKRSGHEGTFWRNVQKTPTNWIWTGQTTTNHNTVNCKKYRYGKYELCTKETANRAKPTKAHASQMAHRICLFLVFGSSVPSEHDVFPFNGDHLDINPDNLGVRCTATGQEWTAAAFYQRQAAA